jgi:D-glycero-D-manno-heptose 1,7-bisphosphate phosphatase
MTGRPGQAVILCGGLGTRMRPFTDTMPKPMIPVSGRPFLAYLIEQLREQGIRRVLLLTGYRGEMIKEYFGDGEASGIEIGYSHGPAEWDTGRRVWEARSQLEAQFLLLYSDNFVPFNLEKLFAFHVAHDGFVSLSLRPKSNGNIRVATNGMVSLYDPSRSAPDLDYVEIGYMIAEREPVLSLFDQPDLSFSTILERLAQRSELHGSVGYDSYHSISDPARWKLAERYLQVKRILMIDRDGTINRRPARGEYVTGWEDFHWIEENAKGMRVLADAGFQFIVISNQAGIARGMVNSATVEAINDRMVHDLRERQIEVLDVYVCPHHWDDGCNCRKPAPGLFFRASHEHQLRMDRTIYIGDDPRDCIAAHNAECHCVLVGPERDLDPGEGIRPAFASPLLPEATSWIVSRFEEWEASH